MDRIRVMKFENTIYTLLVVVALSFPFRVEASAALAADQTALPQDTVIFSWEGDSLLRLRFPLYADISRRWCSQYRVSATPEVCDSLGNSIPLPTSVFAGKKNVRFNSRLLTLGIIDSIPQTVDIRDTVVYDTLLFVPESMRFACPALCVDRFEEGCGRTNRMPDELIAALDCRTDEPDEEPAEETGNDSIVTGPDGIIPVFRPLPDNADTPADAIRPADAGHPANRQMVAAIVPIDRYEPFDPSVPLMADPHAVYIAYPYDNSVIDSAFAGNAISLSIIDEMVELLNRDSARDIARVRIIGSASIEGDETRNIDLSKRRAEALKQYLLDKYSLPFDDIEVIAAGEAWADFRADVAATDLSDLPERDRILQIIDGSRDPDDKEWLIKTLDGGKPWRYISEHILPRQRVAGFIKIYYRNAE